MYFPYLRGRQYELLAIRELMGKQELNSNIIPIIEPVKLSSTLLSTIREVIKVGKQISVICNSDIDSFKDDFYSDEKTTEKEKFLELLESPLVLKTFIVKKDWKEDIKNFKVTNSKEMIIICNNIDFINEYNDEYKDGVYPKYTIVPEDPKFRRRIIAENLVSLDDKFNKRSRNSDYLITPDEFFSEEHLYYNENKSVGFSDYSVIGKEFSEGGFAPYAVAIHMVYFDCNDNSLRIKHYVSDSNEDIKNPAKKFYEAITKLNNDKHKLGKTKALEKLVEYYETQGYPGLGSIKKLSLIHHLELINNFFNNGEDK